MYKDSTRSKSRSSTKRKTMCFVLHLEWLFGWGFYSMWWFPWQGSPSSVVGAKISGRTNALNTVSLLRHTHTRPLKVKSQIWRIFPIAKPPLSRLHTLCLLKGRDLRGEKQWIKDDRLTNFSPHGTPRMSSLITPKNPTTTTRCIAEERFR